jgi:hypothetical protein
MTQQIIEIQPAISDELFDFEFDPATLMIKMDYKIVGNDKVYAHLTSLNENEHINGALALLDVGETAKICMDTSDKWLYVM